MNFHGTNRSLKSSWRIYKSWQNRRADPNTGMKMDGLYPADLKRGSLFQVRCFSQRQAFDPPATYAQRYARKNKFWERSYGEAQLEHSNRS